MSNRSAAPSPTAASLFERAFLRTHSLRARQQQRFGFAHQPDRGFDCVPAQLPQRGDAFIAVDYQVATLFRGHHNDGCLLAALSQRGQQVALAARLADSQVLPAQVELVKLQLHGFRAESEYAGGRNWSFAEIGEVRLELPWHQ